MMTNLRPQQRQGSIRASFDAIRERILAAGATGRAAARGIAVLVTASSPGEGVTSIAMGLGQAFARGLECRVLVIDHDATARGIAMRIGVQTKVVDLVREPAAASEILSRVQPLEEQGFDLITLPPHHARVVERRVRESVLEKFRAAYDVILVDAGSLQTHAPLLWGRQVDQTILVVDTTLITAAVLERVKTDLTYADQKLTGVILNKRPLPVPDTLYRRLR